MNILRDNLQKWNAENTSLLANCNPGIQASLTYLKLFLAPVLVRVEFIFMNSRLAFLEKCLRNVYLEHDYIFVVA